MSNGVKYYLQTSLFFEDRQTGHTTLSLVYIYYQKRYPDISYYVDHKMYYLSIYFFFPEYQLSTECCGLLLGVAFSKFCQQLFPPSEHVLPLQY